MVSKPKLFNALLVGSTCLGGTNIALAAEAAPKATLEEIIVTARKQDETVQTVPVAITALSTEALVTHQVKNIVDLQKSTPNLSIATGAPSSSGFTFVAIRGQTNLQPGAAADPAIGIYLDGVYIPRPSQGLFNLEDLDRVEILRGPQGTLFGRNTTGGAVSITTSDPTGDFFAKIKGDVGNYDYRSVSTTLNLPIKGEELAARVTYSYTKHDGYGKNETLDRPANDELGNQFVRAKLKIAPADANWNLVLSADANKQHDSGQIVAFTAFDPAIPAGAVAGGLGPQLAQGFHDYLQGQNLPQYYQTSSNWYKTYGSGITDGQKPGDSLSASGVGANLGVDLGWAELKSITGYRYSNNVGNIDLDGTPVNLLGGNNKYESRQWSEELQLSGELDKLNWITGLYYSHETGREFSVFQSFGVLNDFLGSVFPFPVPPANIGRNDADVKNISKGVFAQGYYNLTDDLRLEAGVRETWDFREAKLHNVAVNGAPGDQIVVVGGAPGINCQVVPDSGDPANCTQTEGQNFKYPAWTLGLDYQMSEAAFLYAKTNGAAMAGGWNLRIGSVPAFEPEKVRDIEIGAKLDWLDHQLRTNFAYFHSWQSQVQRNVSTVIGTTSTQYVQNSGKVQIDGFEFELTALPWTGMELTASTGLLWGHYESGTFKETQQDANGNPVVVDRSGEKLPAFPQRSASVGATQTVPMDLGDLSLHLDYAYISERYFAQGTTANPALEAAVATQNELGRAPGYGLFNGRIAFKIPKPEIELSLWGRNLGDKQYVTRTFADLYAAGLGFATQYVGEPRTFGVSAEYKFE